MKLYNNYRSVRYLGVGRFCFILVIVAILISCSGQEPTVVEGEAQGTYYRVCYYDNRDLRPQIESMLQAFDQSASLWVDSSLLRRLNDNQTDSLDAILDEMLRQSLYIYEYTGGAFDCRVGRLVQAWGFSFKTRSEPDSLQLAEMLQAAHSGLSVENGRLVKENPATELDFNAIAQGYSVDLLSKMMDSMGVANYLIDVGGEVIARGAKPGGNPWRVGIERPAAERYDAPDVQSVIKLNNASVVTSGSYRKYYERDGVRYSHTIDPITGQPVRHSLLSVSVVEDECWLADAMATAYMVMGLDSALSFIATHPNQPGTGAVMFIFDDDGTLKTYETEQFKTLVIKENE